MEKVNHSTETTRAPGRGERLVRTEELQGVLRDLGEPDPNRFFEEIDAIADPTPREWSDSDW